MRPFFAARSPVNLKTLVSVMLLALPAIAHAEGDLLVAPTRVVFQGGTRSEEIALVNRGSKRATYRISFINKRMAEDGTFSDITEAKDGDAFADPLVRLSQREITLDPGQPQTIRVLLRKPEGLADGEYRSHLLFRAVPDAQAPTLDSKQNGISIQLTPVFGVSIPVIVRQGALEASASISEVRRIAPKAGAAAAIELKLAREGNRSIYGDVRLVHARQPEQSIAEVRGIAVYVPNRARSVKVELTPAQWQQLGSGDALVTFAEGSAQLNAVSAEHPLEP